MHCWEKDRAVWKDGQNARNRSKLFAGATWHRRGCEYGKDQTHFHIVRSSARLAARKMSVKCESDKGKIEKEEISDVNREGDFNKGSGDKEDQVVSDANGEAGEVWNVLAGGIGGERRGGGIVKERRRSSRIGQ